jgi:hypothetical protein
MFTPNCLLFNYSFNSCTLLCKTWGTKVWVWHESALLVTCSQDTSVSIVTRLQAGWYGVQIPANARDFPVLQNAPDQLWGEPSLLFSEYRRTWTGVKRSAVRAWSWPLTCTSAKGKNEWSFTSALPVCLHGVDRDNFTFYCRSCAIWVCWDVPVDPLIM